MAKGKGSLSGGTKTEKKGSHENENSNKRNSAGLLRLDEIK